MVGIRLVTVDYKANVGLIPMLTVNEELQVDLSW